MSSMMVAKCKADHLGRFFIQHGSNLTPTKPGSCGMTAPLISRKDCEPYNHTPRGLLLHLPDGTKVSPLLTVCPSDSPMGPVRMNLYEAQFHITSPRQRVQLIRTVPMLEIRNALTS